VVGHAEVFVSARDGHLREDFHYGVEADGAKGEKGNGLRVKDAVFIFVGDEDVWPCTSHSNDRGDVEFLRQYQNLVLIDHNMDEH